MTTADEAITTAVDSLNKRFGTGAVINANDKKPFIQTLAIPTGALALDLALGVGGIPRGRITEIYGSESAGKTTLALHVLAEAQKVGRVAFIDVEHALDPVYATAIGIDLDEMLLSQPSSGEEALEILETLVNTNAIPAIAVDSVAALVPQAEIDGEMGDTQVGLQARLMSKAMRKLTAAVNNSRTAVLFMNQIREKVGISYGNPEVTPGGRALKFYASVRIDLRRSETLKQSGQEVGSRTRARIVKNKVAAPFKTAYFDIMYGAGISKSGNILDIGAEMGIIKKAGAYYSFDQTRLGQGREAAKNFLDANSEVTQQIEAMIRDATITPAGNQPPPLEEAEPPAQAAD